MKNKINRQDLQNPEVISGLLEKVNLQIFGSVREQADTLMASRQACSKRGYHAVGREPERDDELMICYDCELWFNREFAKSCELNYRVVEEQ